MTRPLTRNASTATAALNDPLGGVHLFAWHYSSLSPRVELETMLSTLNVVDSYPVGISSADPEQLYAHEKKLLEEWRVLPLVALPEYIGLSQKVRDWMPARWGEWHVDDVWLDRSEPGSARPADSNGTAAPVIPPASASPGAKL